MLPVSQKYKEIAQKRLVSYEISQPDVFSLALLASLARRVEPELLRVLRLNLSYYFEKKKRPTVGTESALWFSSLVESRGAESITLLPDVLENLRSRLKQQKKLLEEVYLITKRVHKNVPPVINWEEELIYYGLSSEFTEEKRADLIHKSALEAVKAVKGGNRRSLEELVIDISQRVPTTVVNHESFIKLLSLSQARLVQYKSSSILGGNQLKHATTLLRIKRHGNYLQVGENIEDAEFEISIPNIIPLIIQVFFPRGPKQSYLIPQYDVVNIPMPALQNTVLIQALDGNVYKLDFSHLQYFDKAKRNEFSVPSNFTEPGYLIPESLKDALRRRQVIPFVGAGVSRTVKKKYEDATESFNPLFPSWQEFLMAAANKLDEENKSPKANVVRSLLYDSPPDYLEAAQRAFDGLGQNQWHTLLNENFGKDINLVDKESLELAQLVWNLGSNLVVTTNFDLVLQTAHESPKRVASLDTQSVAFGELQKNWQPKRPTVLHLHGHIHNKAGLVFTREQYSEFYNLNNNRAKLEVIRDLFTNRTILFIGASFDDLSTLRQLEKVNLIYRSGANSFYVLIHESEKDNPNIPEYVQKITFSDFGAPLVNLVRQLTEIVEDEFETEPDTEETHQYNSEKEYYFNVPYNSKGKEFVGRVGKIEEIWNLLNKDGSASIGQAVSLKGFGGLGKTQLAVEYAHAYRDNYKNGVFWLVADEDIDNQLLQIADQRGWINQYDKTINQLDVAKARFLRLSRCLIIFDNVESYADIKDYLPITDLQTHILITSREKIAQFHSIDLELLSRDESREFLLKVSNRHLQDETEKRHLEHILELLGDIPLAIELVSGYLAEHEIVSFTQYHQYLNDIPLDLIEKEFPQSSFTNHDRSLIRTLRISEKIIKDKPLMVEVLNILAWSGNSSMGISLLKALVESDNDFNFKTALADAHKLRLLRKDEDAERYAVHRLLAKIIRYENPLKEQKEWNQKIINNLQSWFDERKDEFNYLAEFEAEIEHLYEWESHINAILPRQFVWLTALKSYPFWHRGNYQRALEFLEKSLRLYQSEKLEDNKLLAEIRNDLGVIYGKLGNYKKALEYLSQALNIRKDLFGEKHHDTATSLTGLGEINFEIGNYQEALKYQLQALEIRRELFSEKHPAITVSLNSIGLIYDKLGNLQQALKYHSQSLEIRLEIFGEMHPNTAISLNSIGVTYGELGNYQEALKYQEQALEIQQKLFSDRHPDVVISLNSLGTSYLKLRNNKKAVEYFDTALKLSRELVGDSHPLTVSICVNLILALLEIGNVEKAGRLAGEFLRYIPPDNPHRKTFEKYGAVYSKSSKSKRKRRR